MKSTARRERKRHFLNYNANISADAEIVCTRKKERKREKPRNERIERLSFVVQNFNVRIHRNVSSLAHAVDALLLTY